MEVVRWKENHEKRTELGINPYAACLLPFPIVSQPIEQYPNLRSSLSQRMSINVTTACSCMSFMNGLFSNPISLGKGIFFQFEQRYPYLANYPRFRSPQFCPLLQYSGQQTASFIGNLASAFHQVCNEGQPCFSSDSDSVQRQRQKKGNY